jgi:succinate dehydrogenase/fumarate reductase flavoprotein subunit
MVISVKICRTPWLSKPCLKRFVPAEVLNVELRGKYKMTVFHEYFKKEGRAPAWPYPVGYEQVQEIETDVLVLGGGIAGCWAAISAARKGVKVALVEKGATVRSGAGGPGCDHWCDTAANPLSKVNPDEWAQRLTEANGGYSNGIGRQIQCRENYDTLLELEKMGGKIRDYDDRYQGAEGRDDRTKFLISPRANPFHDTNVVIRVWGTTFKPALKKECERLGVKIYDRIMATSLLSERGFQGARIAGAIGINNRTGEFMVFKAKATVLCTAGAGSIWIFNTELAGYSTMTSRALSGDGAVMAWRAGAELTSMERSFVMRIAGGYKHKWYTGAGDASYENVPLVDANGKKLPVVSEPSWGVGRELLDRSGQAGLWAAIRQGVLKGEYALPFYGDFPAMPEIERKATWNMLLEEEATTKVIVDSFTEAGFDPSKDLLQNYQFLEGTTPAHWRNASGGGLVIDWDLKTTLEGLYAAGTQLFFPGDHSFAAATGRYAGRKAADYTRQVDRAEISKEQVALEKARIYSPAKRSDGLEWKELHAGIARTMQYFCSEYKTELLFKMGLDSLQEIEKRWVPKLYALDPHKLMRGLEDLSILTYAQIIIHASLARMASSKFLDFRRIDYPEMDPPEWKKFITIKLENDKVRVGELPHNYWGDLKENYEAHNKDYTGVCQGW